MRCALSKISRTRSLKRSLSSAAPRAACALGDDQALWMPFSANQAFMEDETPRVVTGGKGMYWYDASGRKILDSAGGLWCNAAGISPEPVVKAVQDQVAKLSYAPSFQMSHDMAFQWAEDIVNQGSLKQRGLDKVFFTMCGSTSVDTSMKMALAYHRANGQGQRTRFIGRERGYHGVGFGGITVGGIAPNRVAFSTCLLPGVDHLPHTHNLEHNAFAKGQPEWGAHLADELENIVALHGGDNIAAVFVEPVAGSTGVLPPPVGYLEKLRATCDKHGILLVFDEVITGFGRLGAPFGVDKFDVTPDIITTAKGLTGAVVPAGAVIAKGDIFDTIVNNASAGAIEFFHGYTYSAHPVAAAAGIAMLKHFNEDGLFERASALSQPFEDAIHGSFADHPAVADVRNCGLMGGVQFHTPEGHSPGALGAALMKHAWHKEDLYIRVTGDTVAFSPAFIADESTFEDMFARLARSVDAVKPQFA